MKMTQKKRKRRTRTSLSKWSIGDLKRIGRRLPDLELKKNFKRM